MTAPFVRERAISPAAFIRGRLRGEIRGQAAALGDAAIRTRAWDLAFLVASVATIVLLLRLGRDLTFNGDEWTFLAERMTPSLDAYLRPHNEHLSATLVLLYQAMSRFVGLQSYVPYLALLAVVHVVATTGLYRLLVAVAGRPTAFAGALVMLVLGPAFEDLLWAFQVGFVAATAAGVWALSAMLDAPGRGRHIGVTALLALGVATQGVGLFFLVAAGVYAAVRRGSRSYLPGIVTVGVLYVGWFLWYGRSGLDATRPPFSLEGLGSVLAFVEGGMAKAIGSVTALGIESGRVLAVVLLVALGSAWLRGRTIPALTIASLSGLATEFVLIALARAHLGADQASASRYVYPAAMLVLIIVGSMLGAPSSPRIARRRLVLIPLAVAVVFTNVIDLRAGRDYFLGVARETRAVIGYARDYADSPAVPDDRSLFPLPTVARLRQLVDDLGDPSVAVGRGPYPSAEPAERDRALLRVVGGASVAAAPGPMRSESASVLDHGGVLLETDGRCVLARSISEPGWVTVAVPDTSMLAVGSEFSGTIGVALGLSAAPLPESAIHVDISPEQQTWFKVPPSPDGAMWQVRVDASTTVGRTTICVETPRVEPS